MPELPSIKIFFSYSHKDKTLLAELQKQLKPLKRADLISHWYDGEINPGENWNESIKKNLADADIILFLVSPDFLDSEYIYEHEIKVAIERHKRGEAVVVPVLLRKCDIEYTLFKDIQGLPTGFEPVNSSKWFSIDDACFDVVEGLKKIINKERRKKEILLKSGDKEQLGTGLPPVPKSVRKNSFFGRIKKMVSSSTEDDDLRYKILLQKSELLFIDNEHHEIAGEIHDDLGQRLAIAKLIIGSIRMKKDSTEQDIEAVHEILAYSLNSLRQISHRLSKGYFETDFDLKQALLELESHYMRVSDLRFTLLFRSIEQLQNPRNYYPKLATVITIQRIKTVPVPFSASANQLGFISAISAGKLMRAKNFNSLVSLLQNPSGTESSSFASK